jgi:hypothetical protein
MALDAVNGYIPAGKLAQAYDPDGSTAWFQVDGRYYGFPDGVIPTERGKVYHLADESAVKAAIVARRHTHELPHHPLEARLS